MAQVADSDGWFWRRDATLLGRQWDIFPPGTYVEVMNVYGDSSFGYSEDFYWGYDGEDEVTIVKARIATEPMKESTEEKNKDKESDDPKYSDNLWVFVDLLSALSHDMARKQKLLAACQSTEIKRIEKESIRVVESFLEAMKRIAE